MSEIRIRLLAADELDAAVALSSAAGWNQELEDWRMLLTLAPRGSFAAIAGGRLVGTVIALDYGAPSSPGTLRTESGDETFAWIAMMLVAPDWRGRGVGRSLLEAAIDSVPAGRPIRLDATPMGRPLYVAFGFADETKLTRYVSDASTRHAASAGDVAALPDVRPLTDADLPAVIACDRLIFGGHRGALLRLVRTRDPQYAWIAPRVGSAPQYCFGRRGRLFDQIGPVICQDEDAARALVNAAIEGAEGRPIQLDVFDERTAFAAWLRTRGFRVHRPLFRMRRPARAVGPIAGEIRPGPIEFAVLGPEFA